jgi:hypothetical protein
MAISVSVQNKFQIIVPARVDRAVRGAPQLDAPDVDDRGWVSNRAAGLNVSNARGALFGATVGDVIRLRVVREDLDDVPLFVTVTGNQVAIDQPARGGPLSADGIFAVRAVDDTTVGSKVQVRLGSAGGPVICEADAHTFTPSTVKITPHVCTIHSAANAGAGTGVAPTVGGNAAARGTALDDAQIGVIFRIVAAIWRPAGIQFNIAPARQEVFTGFTANDFAAQGGIGSEEDRVMGRNAANQRCNIYFLRIMDRSLGVGVNSVTRAANNFSQSGILIGVEGSSSNNLGGGVTFRSSAGADLVHEIGNDVAHEIGHFLTLNHADNIDAVAATPNGRTDTYNRRFLMHPINLLPSAASPQTAISVPRFDDIGYGTVSGRGHRGCLVTLKDHPSHTSDGEVVAVRRRLRSPNLHA